MFKSKSVLRFGMALGLLTGAMAFTACAPTQKSINITYVEYPSFFTSNDTYRTVVIGPVENAFDTGKYENMVATNLMAKIQNNGSYKVIDATKTQLDNEGLAAKGREKDPNALVVSSILTNYGEIRSSELRSVGIETTTSSFTAGASEYGASQNRSASLEINGQKAAQAQSNRSAIENNAYASATQTRKTVNYPVVNFNRGVYAKLNVVVRRAADDEIVANEFVYALVTESSINGLNMSDSEERLKRALDDVTTNAVYYVAPSYETISINPDSILLVQKFGPNNWVNTNSFEIADNIHVVFNMPPRVAYNDFQIVLKAEGYPKPIDARNINYTEPVALDYRAADIYQNTGVKSFAVQVVFNGQVIAQKAFKINVVR